MQKKFDYYCNLQNIQNNFLSFYKQIRNHFVELSYFLFLILEYLPKLFLEIQLFFKSAKYFEVRGEV
jgi:hypothetical protein